MLRKTKKLLTRKKNRSKKSSYKKGGGRKKWSNKKKAIAALATSALLVGAYKAVNVVNKFIQKFIAKLKENNANDIADMLNKAKDKTREHVCQLFITGAQKRDFTELADYLLSMHTNVLIRLPNLNKAHEEHKKNSEELKRIIDSIWVNKITSVDVENLAETLKKNYTK
jgi:hypothetical protein